MMKTYCYQCGTAITYASEKPNFCVKCGCDLNSTKATKKVAPPAVETEIDMAEEESVVSLPAINQVEVDINASSGSAIPLGQIAGTSQGGGGIVDDFKAPESQQMTEQQIMDDFKKEAGALRPKPEK